MEYIVEVHNRPSIKQNWVERSEPDFDYWFIINVEKGKPVFKEMQEKALEIVNSKFGDYKANELAILNRTDDRLKISKQSLEDLRNGEVLCYLLSRWNGHTYVDNK